MPNDMQTKVDGNPTGDVTKSGNPDHQADGKFGTKKTKKQIDADFSYPFCNHKILPVLQKKCSDFDATVYDVYDPILGFSKEVAEKLDMDGTDYILMRNGQEYSIDLKTVTTGNGEIPDYISIPLWHFDENYKDDQTGVKGKQNYGWGLKNNSTHFYLFSLPKEVDNINEFSLDKHGDIEYDAFILSKPEFKEILFDNFFDDGKSINGHDAMFKLTRTMFNINKKIDFDLKNRKKRKIQQEQDYKNGKIKEMEKIDLTPKFYDEFKVKYKSDGKVERMEKNIPGKDGYTLKLIMDLEYVSDVPYPRQNIYLRCHKNVFKNSESCQLLNPKENDDNVFKNYFNI